MNQAPVRRSLALRRLGTLTVLALSSSLLTGTAQYTTPITLRVTSSFDGRITLPLRSKWIVKVFMTPDDTSFAGNTLFFPRDEVESPQENIESVTYLVDNQVRWIARKMPYTYGGWAGYFTTTWLKPGKHTFTAAVKMTDGRTASNTVTATVGKPPAPPAALAGMWTRNIQPPQAELQGKWNLVFDEIGTWLTDPTSTGVAELMSVQGDTLYVISPIQMGLADIGVPAYGAKSIGGNTCGDGGAQSLQYPVSAFKWAVKGDQLTLTHVKTQNACPDRAFLWSGTWTRVKNPPARGSLIPGK
ncbi:hypothetical protein [Deinococcus yavapaiensis]|uniref:Uncharacterized protein n=1 Tax=Deinococcus yavapaiensis KR-236 TaxID=694435 RepID=A0A318S357_9DEIO|nr:hypothetical protein [Deinococcus yavapaiensis]PYE48377.1 hypothetical protein DES52_13020 [Deinococcus yavapaiensis KR-236]